MRRLLTLGLGLLALGLAPRAADHDPSACTPTTSTHERWPAKTRATPPAPIEPSDITVKALIDVDLPARQSPMPEEAMPGTDEMKIYDLDAYVMLVKQPPDDCDIHLEVADTPDPAADRVIVEVPQKDAQLQSDVLTFLGLTSISSTPHTFTATTAVKLYFIGYGYFDLPHATQDGAKAGHAHGSAKVATILELHPVFAVNKSEQDTSKTLHLHRRS